MHHPSVIFSFVFISKGCAVETRGRVVDTWTLQVNLRPLTSLIYGIIVKVKTSMYLFRRFEIIASCTTSSLSCLVLSYHPFVFVPVLDNAITFFLFEILLGCLHRVYLDCKTKCITTNKVINLANFFHFILPASKKIPNGNLIFLNGLTMLSGTNQRVTFIHIQF